MSLLDNLVSYWALDEASGNALDSHGSNALTASNAPGSAAGKVSTSRSFNGSNQSFTLADNTSLSAGDIDFSIGVWVYLSAKSVNRQVIGKWRASTNSREFRIVYASGTDRFLFQISANGVASTTLTASNFGAPALNTWYYIVAWHDCNANEIGIAVNNGTPNTTAHAGGAFNGTSDFTLGVLGNEPGDFWNGRIDEAAFWKKVLTADERTQLNNSGNGLSYAQLAPVTVSPRRRRDQDNERFARL